MAELGIGDALEQEVLLEPPDDTGTEPYLTIQAHVLRWPRWDDPTSRVWSRWLVTTFPPEVARHVALLIEPARSCPETAGAVASLPPPPP